MGIGVFHLVRQANGIGPFARFVATYRRQPAGVDHELVLIFKGFRGDRETREYGSLLENLPHKRVFMSDRGLDLGPYFAAVKRFDYEAFCFLNSYSRFLDGDWLAKFHRCVQLPGVGLVGATGSYQSFATAAGNRERALARLNPSARLRWRVRHILSDREPRLMVQRTAAWILGAAGLWDPKRHFSPFPNYHVRTNAFMASRELLLKIRIKPMLFKLSAFLFESGKDSLTRQVLNLGMRPLVVARNGEAFEKEDWHRSNTFRQSSQEGLLVADNQTDAYEEADPRERARLSRLAWGEYARPGRE